MYSMKKTIFKGLETALLTGVVGISAVNNEELGLAVVTIISAAAGFAYRAIINWIKNRKKV